MYVSCIQILLKSDTKTANKIKCTKGEGLSQTTLNGSPKLILYTQGTWSLLQRKHQVLSELRTQ